MDNPDISVMLKIISSAVGVAKKAGSEIRRITQSGILDVVDKGVQDYQTEADRLAQRMIVATLTKRFPHTIIVGEESLAEDKEADSRLVVNSYDEAVLRARLPNHYYSLLQPDFSVWVDPLDGTAEFVKGLYEHVTILIGLSVCGKAVAGIIHQPFYGYERLKSSCDSKNIDVTTLEGRTIWGVVGHGCYGLSPMALPQDKLIIATTASHGNRDIEESIRGLKPDEVLKVGGAGHKVLLVAEGRAHSYVFPSNGSKRWDTCAPEAILESIGGKLTNTFGEYIEYRFRADRDYQNYLGVIASINPAVHSRIMRELPEPVKHRLRYRTGFQF